MSDSELEVLGAFAVMVLCAVLSQQTGEALLYALEHGWADRPFPLRNAYVRDGPAWVVGSVTLLAGLLGTAAGAERLGRKLPGRF